MLFASAASLHGATMFVSLFVSQGSAEGDTIVVYPSKIDPHCEALVFVLSASDTDVSTMNLSTPDALQFNGHSAGEASTSYLTPCIGGFFTLRFQQWKHSSLSGCKPPATVAVQCEQC